MAQIDFNKKEVNKGSKIAEKFLGGKSDKNNFAFNQAMKLMQGKNAKYLIGFIIYLILSGLTYNIYLLFHPVYLLVYISSLICIILLILLFRFLKLKSKKSKK